MHNQDNVNEVVRTDLADILSRLAIMEEKISTTSQVGQQVSPENHQTLRRRLSRRQARSFNLF
jgi:hypothetical protein